METALSKKIAATLHLLVSELEPDDRMEAVGHIFGWALAFARAEFFKIAKQAAKDSGVLLATRAEFIRLADVRVRQLVDLFLTADPDLAMADAYQGKGGSA